MTNIGQTVEHGDGQTCQEALWRPDFGSDMPGPIWDALITAHDVARNNASGFIVRVWQATTDQFNWVFGDIQFPDSHMPHRFDSDRVPVGEFMELWRKNVWDAPRHGYSRAGDEG